MPFAWHLSYQTAPMHTPCGTAPTREEAERAASIACQLEEVRGLSPDALAWHVAEERAAVPAPKRPRPPCACRPRLCTTLPEGDPRRADRLCRRGRALMDALLAAERDLCAAPRDERGRAERERAHATWEAAAALVQAHLLRVTS